MFEFLSYISQYLFLFILHIAHSESFPKPLKKEEERHYLELCAQGVQALGKLIQFYNHNHLSF